MKTVDYIVASLLSTGCILMLIAGFKKHPSVVIGLSSITPLVIFRVVEDVAIKRRFNEMSKRSKPRTIPYEEEFALLERQRQEIRELSLEVVKLAVIEAESNKKLALIQEEVQLMLSDIEEKASIKNVIKSCENCKFYSFDFNLKCAVNPSHSWHKDGECKEWELSEKSECHQKWEY